MNLFLQAAASFCITWLVLWAVSRSAIARQLQDLPNERSLHTRPVPRAGGAGLLAGLLVGVAFVPTSLSAPLGLALIAYLTLAVVSWFDDRSELPARIRLLVHLVLSAGWLIGSGVSWLWLPVLTLGLAWCANLYNFMDGADGLAGGMALFGFATYGVAAALAGDPALAAICTALVAAAAAFLCFNFHPASLFMGDSGSVPVGFLAGALGLYGVFEHLWTPIFPLIAFFPFAFDATLTLLRRGLAGKPVWHAHREHLYQRAVLAGLGHRTMALRAYLLMVVCSLCAISVQKGSPTAQALIMLAMLLCGWIVARRVDSLYRSRQPSS